MCHLLCVDYRGLLALWEYMQHHLKIDPDPVWADIKDLVVKTVIR